MVSSLSPGMLDLVCTNNFSGLAEGHPCNPKIPKLVCCWSNDIEN